MNDTKDFNTKRSVLTGILIFLVLHAGTHLSLMARTDLAVSDFFLPSAFALVMIYWTAKPRIVIALVFINSVASSYFWGNPLDKWPFYFLYAIPETLFAFLTWYLFIKLLGGKIWLPDTRNFVLFLVVGVFIPSLTSAFSLQSMLYLTGDQPQHLFGRYLASNLLSEFFNTFFFVVPALYFVTPRLQRKGVLPDLDKKIPFPEPLSQGVILELLVLFVCLFALVFLVDFKEYWFIYGVFPLYIAIRFGFGATLITNMYILIIIYVLPRFYGRFGENLVQDYLDVMNVFLGACLLFIFAAITGRVINDLKSADRKLKHQYAELEKTNHELNQFVYRVSHDLSAPLKSVRGLVNLGKFSLKPSEHLELFSRIETSVSRLEEFIAEIMDYFNNKRFKVNCEVINIRNLCEEILKGLPNLLETKPVKVFYDLKNEVIVQDAVRLKIILKNILFNALKYQKNSTDHQPFIKISSTKKGENIRIEIKDNGLGIKQDQLKHVFSMFYRGHTHSTGAGLGLYIAREVVAKLNGNIAVNSTYGVGTSFVIYLKDQPFSSPDYSTIQKAAVV